MAVAPRIIEEVSSSSSSDVDDLSIGVPDAPTPITSGDTSPTQELDEDAVLTSQKKKKKKKPKKSAKAKETAAAVAAKAKGQDSNGRPPVLCISRNKHWRYISSYHVHPATLSTPELRMPLPAPSTNNLASKYRDRYYSLGDYSPPDSPGATFSSLPPPFPTAKPGKAAPPPIDPGVFRSVTSIRRLIDEAAELSVRASSGLSAAELGSMRGGSGLNGNPWAAAQSLGLNPLGNGGGRNVTMSAMRIHRLRVLAVQKLAQAYKADEIASSVMVMQGGSVFDDLAERVLRHDPNDLDAKYVHFFHEKIPSRQLAESTSTKILDELIAAQPQHLEYYRTRGVVHCFRDEYLQATKDFTYALKEARAVRKAKMMHRSITGIDGGRFTKNGKRKKTSSAGGHTNGQAPPDGTSALGADSIVDGLDGEPLLLHPSALPNAPDPIEHQLLFLRGAAYLQHAVFLVESAVLALEGVRKVPSIDGAELRLCYIENGKYGGVEIGNPDGPLGAKDSVKVHAYREVLGDETFREQITTMLRKSIRDHEKFLSHFDSIESVGPLRDGGDLASQTEYAFVLSEPMRPGGHRHHHHHSTGTSSMIPAEFPAIFTTYHPLLVESHFSVLIAQLMLADFPAILPTFARTAALVDSLEGYPVFMPPRSMAQAEFLEVLERLAGGWRHGIQPHSLVNSHSAAPFAHRGKGRLLAIEAPPLPRGLLHAPPTHTQFSSNSAFPPPEHQCAASSSSVSTSRKNSSSQGESSSTPWPEDAHVFDYTNRARALDCARILLAPVAKRQREKTGRTTADAMHGLGGKAKSSTINIPLHGPRVEVVLAWLGAVHLPELDAWFLEAEDLLNVCLTCKRLSNIATWFLYQNITLTTIPKAIVCFRTIVARPQVGLAASHSKSLPTYSRQTQANLSLVSSDWLPPPYLRGPTELNQLTTCMMFLSPDVVTFLNAHPSLTQVSITPNYFSSTPLYMDEIEDIVLPNLISLNTTSSLMRLFCPCPLLEIAGMTWVDMDADEVLPRFGASPNLSKMSHAMFPSNMGVIAAVAKHLPHLDTLLLRLMPEADSDDEPEAEMNILLDSAVEQSIRSFQSLSTLRILHLTEPTNQSPPAFPDIAKELDRLTRWSKACPTLQTCSFDSRIGWERIWDHAFLPLGFAEFWPWMGWAIANGKYKYLGESRLAQLTDTVQAYAEQSESQR
ncbi:hypothetical protein H0H81_008814 [Sphagnurus paluster]|uniref:Uncharacterized protein n=1 Tax=Sphagnurus paluster TaxID=117069 RepID=A0A9P7FWY2_9AGAR|nr:hypothetical protein H0H81_008814 [Sphagnurus paluster]